MVKIVVFFRTGNIMRRATYHCSYWKVEKDILFCESEWIPLATVDTFAVVSL